MFEIYRRQPAEKGKPQLMIAGLWLVISLLNFSLSWWRFEHVKARGESIGAFRSESLVFWGFMIVFWLVYGVRMWRRSRAEEASDKMGELEQR